MPRYIVRLERDDQEWFLEYSTIVDAPVTRGMTLSEFETHYRNYHGERAMSDLPLRLARVRSTGTSAHSGESPSLMMGWNRAGENESSLSLDQIIDFYCLCGGKGERPWGTFIAYVDGRDWSVERTFLPSELLKRAGKEGRRLRDENGDIVDLDTPLTIDRNVEFVTEEG